LSFNSYHISSLLTCVWFYRRDIPSGNAVDLCFKSARFESQPRHWLLGLRFSLMLRKISCKIQEYYIISFSFRSVEYYKRQEIERPRNYPALAARTSVSASSAKFITGQELNVTYTTIRQMSLPFITSDTEIVVK
jgi:hypothetical protein